MNLKQTLMLAGGAYLIGRLTANVSGDDLRAFGERVRDMKGDDVRKYAVHLSDDALDRIGLVRKSQVSGATLPVIGGLGAGILVGAGLALLFAPQAGSETRAKIGERVEKIRHRGNGVGDQAQETSTPEATTGF